MKISKVKIKNFRSYKDETVIILKDMNIILGKNDIGKSTILEALDIFFNDGKGCISISKDDINKYSGDINIEISVTFSNFDDEIILETIPTSLSGEYILNNEGELEIKKIYSGTTMKSTSYIIANHPSNDDFLSNLLITKIRDLQKYVGDNSINVIGKNSVSADLRKAIRESYQNLVLSIQEIQVDKEDAKKLWEQIQIKLPVYTLFQADRSNTDQDDEIQNPMNIALKNILAQPKIIEKLENVFNEVKIKMEEVAKGTLIQLHNINSTLAEQLSPKLPDFEKLGWNKAFPKTEISSDDIPLNKRGSGVKRMILLSFFLNEIERRKNEEGLADIIYAFEEPETSQHPAHQEILVRAFNELSRKDGVQVILTTHSPYVYKEFTKNSDVNLIHIGEDNGNKVVEDIFSNFNIFPHSPSWGEINYFVYGLPTFEFFDELYSRLEELNNTGNHVDDYIAQKSGIIQKNNSWIKLDRSGSQITIQHTYITCIRHQIHHSDNTLNPDYKSRIEEGIKDMINILK